MIASDTGPVGDASVRLCHVVAGGMPVTGRLTGAPFLHCCTEAQLDFVLARHFAGITSLAVIRFDPTEADGWVEWVRSEPDMEPFPHLHGAIPMANATVTMVSGDQ